VNRLSTSAKEWINNDNFFNKTLELTDIADITEILIKHVFQIMSKTISYNFLPNTTQPY